MPVSETSLLRVHVPCGRLRGVTSHGRQACPCQGDREPWQGCEMSEVAQLCVVCARGKAGGPSRWDWLACRICRELNESLGSHRGRNGLLPLGRQAIMNSVERPRATASGAAREVFTDAVMRRRVSQRQLFAWQVQEVQRLAASETLSAVVLLSEWQRTFPAGRTASRDALRRLLGPPATPTRNADPGGAAYCLRNKLLHAAEARAAQARDDDAWSFADADVQTRPSTTTHTGGTPERRYVWETCSVWACWSSLRIPIGAHRKQDQARRLSMKLGQIHLEEVHDIVDASAAQDDEFRG
jgi:hypothetical protein